MTVTDADREDYNTIVSEFISQHQLDMCFTACVKNILDDLIRRHDISGLSVSLSDLNDIFDYRHMQASTTRDIPAKLDPIISDYGFRAKVGVGLEIEDLESIIEADNRSYPIVDLDGSYFDSVEGYDPRPGADGYQWTHTVIPFVVNHENVLFYDPFGEIMMRSSNVDSPPTERSHTQFYEWWSAPETRWAVWLQREGQRTLTSPEFRGGSNGGD